MTHPGRPSAVAWYVTAALLVATTAWSTARGGAAGGTGAPSVNAVPGAPGAPAQSIVAEAQELRFRARTLHERGELGEALDVASRAAELAPADPQTRALLGAMQSLAGRTRELCARRASCIIRAAGDPTGCRGEEQ